MINLTPTFQPKIHYFKVSIYLKLLNNVANDIFKTKTCFFNVSLNFIFKLQENATSAT